MKPFLEVKNLVKTYSSALAVDNISFAIPKGICFGLLGPNGAGKTTTIEIIEGVSKATSGEILYRGKPRRSGFNEKIGIQFQETALLSFLSVEETLKTFQSLYREPLHLDELIELCHLGKVLKQMNDKISGGQKQRLLLALALINRPDLIFLDEPSTGLDPHARRNLWRIVESIKEQGKTIILTTHYMEEAQSLCDDIVIMDQGKIIAHGSPEKLINTLCQGDRVVLPRNHIGHLLDKFPFPVNERGTKIEIYPQNIKNCLEFLMAKHVDLSSITVRSPNLEDVFIFLTGRKLRD